MKKKQLKIRFIFIIGQHYTFDAQPDHTVILPGWTLKKWGLSSFAFQSF